ncbi:NAD(P)/FAD-dependent oxidoreductase [Candidatus Micrarchaeota archaeon]|nr:NAD(P)/FAD-dependent oxidoreductase [Candidatus Micrarchaeota archaeon]
MYDVIIIGAGPAGLSCARHLKGLKVLVLEKNDSLGKKICSGEISPKVLPDEQFDRGHPWKSITIGTETGKKTVYFENPFLWTVGRYEFENYLMKSCDAEIHFSETVKHITPTYVETSKGKYYYKHLVGADGSFSIVRNYLKLPMKHITGWAYHYVLDVPCSEFSLCWLPKTFPKSYGYVMSKSRKQTMLGLAWTGEFDQAIAAKAKDWAMKEFSIKNYIKLEAMKGNADYRGWKFGNIYLAGDAGGFLNPLTTEGIYYAITSGEGIAKHILRKPEGEKIMKSLESAHRWQVLMFDLATKSPFCWIINWILEDPRKGIRRKIFNWVLWKFMKG